MKYLAVLAFALSTFGCQSLGERDAEGPEHTLEAESAAERARGEQQVPAFEQPRAEALGLLLRER